MSIHLLIAVVLVLLPIASQKQNLQVKPQMPVSPPEIKRTVGAINGVWKGRMTATVPGAPSESFDWMMDCRPVSMATGALCSNSGKASIGVMAESCLLAYDPEGKAVHYMCVTSMGEVHDHKGKWVDPKTIDFEPLLAGMMGQPITETLKWYFPDEETISKTSEVKLRDGSVMHFEFKGKRQ
jgi:hypothetical protein